jgi:crotonobetainyl-CoA:carnitine CoA-transferase CaiB-like acyl-CoA transferase
MVRTLEELLAESHVHERGTLEDVDVPELGKSARVVGAGFRFAHDQPRVQGPVPRLGEHTAEVLSELGLAN